MHIEREQGLLPLETLPEELRVSPAEQADYLDRQGILVETLPGNSILIATHRDTPDQQQTYVDSFLRVGYYDDPPHLMGITHLGEHMVFGGCLEVPNFEEQQRRFIYNGYRIEARTQPFDVTLQLQASSGLTNPSLGIAAGIRNLASMAYQPLIDPLRMSYEKQLILDEYWMRLPSLPWHTGRAIAEALFAADHVLQKIGTGDMESLDRITHEDLIRHVDSYFTPANTMIKMFSDGDRDKYEPQINLMREVWNEIASDHKGIRTRSPDFRKMSKSNMLDASSAYVKSVPFNKNRVCVSTAAVYDAGFYTKESFALGLATGILSTDAFSLLRGSGIGYAPFVNLANVPYTGTFTVQMGIEVDKSRYQELSVQLPTVLKTLIEQALADGLPARRVEALYNAYADVPYSLNGRLQYAFDGLRIWNQVIRSEDIEQSYRSVTDQDVASWLRRFAEEPGALFIVGDI